MSAREIISRAEAKARGLTRYFTGKPCSKNHVAERFTSTCQCSVCLLDFCRAVPREVWNERAKKWRSRNKTHVRERKKKWRGKNKERERRYVMKAKERINRRARQRYDPEARRKKFVESYYIGPTNPNGDKQWLSKAKSQLRNLKRLLRHPNRDHSSWLNEDPRR